MLTKASPRKTVLFYGDSNTYGVDPSMGHSGTCYPEDIRWIGLLKESLGPAWTILENSTVGRCIPSMDFELDELDQCLRQSLQNGPVDVFAVMLGINDYLSLPRPDPGRVGAEMEAFLQRVHSFYTESAADRSALQNRDLRECAEQSADADAGHSESLSGPLSPRLLVIAPPPVDFTGDRFYVRYSTTDGLLTKALHTAARRAGADFIDTAAWDLPLYPGDHIHFTASAHRIFAENICAYFAH